MAYMRCGIEFSSIPGFDHRTLTSFDSGSLSYSLDRGRFHFIHVHFYPAYYSYKVRQSESRSNDLQNSITTILTLRFTPYVP